MIDLGYSVLEIGDELKISVQKVRLYADRFDLGVPKEKIKKKRDCMRCKRPFMSQGPGNRLCEPCRKYAEVVSPWAPNINTARQPKKDKTEIEN